MILHCIQRLTQHINFQIYVPIKSTITLYPPPPPDPRQWSRDHVTLWLLHAGVQYQLGDTHPDRFPMNGKALLLMTREMFLARVPQGGGILFEDIQHKLQKVITEMYEKVSVFDTPPPPPSSKSK